jgi:hypothetical protein
VEVLLGFGRERLLIASGHAVSFAVAQHVT